MERLEEDCQNAAAITAAVAMAGDGGRVFRLFYIDEDVVMAMDGVDDGMDVMKVLHDVYRSDFDGGYTRSNFKRSRPSSRIVLIIMGFIYHNLI